MFRTQFTKLTLKDVQNIVAGGVSAPKRASLLAPKSASALSDALAGEKLRVVLDDKPVPGPKLEYAFDAAGALTVRENGGKAVKCGYGALSLKNITLFTHMLPGTLRGYNVILNWGTGVATVFEMWFIDYEGDPPDTTRGLLSPQDAKAQKPFVNREVQRQAYYGYFECPARERLGAPERRDHLSFGLENAMILWRDDAGSETVSTYTSTTFSTFVETGTPDGWDVLTMPSDILQISDSQYIYSRGEVEYSGRLAVEVLDLFSMQKIGAVFGIDANDKLDYRLYRATGRKLGQYAKFHDFNDKGEKLAPMIESLVDYTQKGARATYRTSVMAKILTEEQLKKAAAKPKIYSQEPAERGMSMHNLPPSPKLTGRGFALRGDDGYEVEYRFLSESELEYRVVASAGGGGGGGGSGGGKGARWSREKYAAMEIDENLFLFGHYRSRVFPPACLICAADLSNGLATILEGNTGGPNELRDVMPTFHFGTVRMQGLTPSRLPRHHFTRELLGRSFAWSYSKDMASQHIYNAPGSYSWTIINWGEPGSPAYRAGGFVWSSPCQYVKLREDVYMMNWTEERWEGGMACIAMNLRIMHDCGFSLGVSPDGGTLSFHDIGAYARDCGRADMEGVYRLEKR